MLARFARTGEEQETLEFRRESTEARFSDGFLALEAAADDSSRVESLSSSALELREQFNRDSDKTRLIALLSPT